MAKIKLKFNEDQLQLIRNLRFRKFNQNFSIELGENAKDNDEIIGDKKTYSAIARDEDGNTISVVPFTCSISNDYGDNLYGIDTFDLYGGSFLYEDMAYILGLYDKVIDGTQEDADGPKFPQDILDKFNQLDSFICENIENIEEILHQFCTEGIKPNVIYWKRTNENIWHIEENEKW